ncbi:hypothetical protein [Streptomyces xanthochromogenes]|uniref:hypothetical protein n=2 Tax=Streptomyces xanthochromogenes TaxID=67384 RepID=UPI0034369E84
MSLALATPLVAAGCGRSSNKQSASASTSGAPPDSGRDATIMIIRHGEKPSSGDPGFDETGKQDKKSLTRQGWERSHALPRLFARTTSTAGSASSAGSAGSASSAGSTGSARSASTAGSAGLPRPLALYAAADQGPHAGAHRMRQTVTPLGAALHVQVNTDFTEGEEKELAAAALAAASPVLICWEHSKIPAIVEALGAAQVAGVPEEWPDRFDLVWVFTRRAGTWTFQPVPQHLLPSDA